MTATNHAITGAVIVAGVSNPLVGLPLALLSHFVLDALPHFGAHTVAHAKSKEFKYILMTDGFLLITFTFLSGYAGYKVGLDWWLLPLGAIFGGIPDLMWLNHYKADLAGETKTWDVVRKAHKAIQRWERSWGWMIEVIWFVGAILILNKLLFG